MRKDHRSFPGVAAAWRTTLPVVLAVMGAAAQAATGSTAADQDTFVSSGEPTTAFGNKGAVMIAAPTAGQNRTEYGLVGFDTAAVKAGFDALYGVGGWQVTEVWLAVSSHHYLAGEQPPNLSLNQIASGQFGLNWIANDGWNQNTVTWNTLTTGSTESLGQFTWTALTAPEASGIHASTWTLGLVPGLVGDILAGNRVSILGQPLDDVVSFQFNQFKAPDHAAAVLNVVAAPVPEPVTSTLLGAGVLTLLARRRAVAGKPS